MSRQTFSIYMSGVPQFRKRLNKIISNYDKYVDTILEEICQEIVNEAKTKLLESRYDVLGLLNNITYTKYGKGKYRVGVRNNSQKEIMHFLEFGTGIVGKDNPHPKASDIGWNYVTNPENIVDYENSTGYNSIGEYVGTEGWFYFDKQLNRFVFTSGLKPVRYLYDTIKKTNIDKIVKRVKARHKNGV